MGFSKPAWNRANSAHVRFGGGLRRAGLRDRQPAGAFHIRAGNADIRYGSEAGSASMSTTAHAKDRPIVIFWYGGAGPKAKVEHRFMGTALAERGYVAYSDYRKYPHVQFPTFVEDGARALVWVREHAHELGADPSRIFVMGHSVGAHLGPCSYQPTSLVPPAVSAGGSDSWTLRDIRLSTRTRSSGGSSTPYRSDDWQPSARRQPGATESAAPWAGRSPRQSLGP
jgi:hypothetical protein